MASDVGAHTLETLLDALDSERPDDDLLNVMSLLIVLVSHAYGRY